jgi:heptosyltransferase-1
MATFRRELQQERYDLVLDTQGLLKSGLITRLAHGRRAGHAPESAREPMAARCYDATFAIPKNLHAVERNRWLAAAAFDYPPDLPLDYGIKAAPLSAAWLPATPYCILLTATSRNDKLWPEQDWLRLGAFLNARGLACVLPCGSSEERQRAERLARQMAQAVVAPPLSLDVMAQLLAGAQAVVGVDTGLSHLAAALARPTLALYCATDPALTGVHGGENARNLGKPGAPPSAEEVAAAVADLLA